MTTTEAIAAIRAGKNVTAPYHVEGYGPGKSCHLWGHAGIDAGGPEGYLRLGLNKDGKLIIDEYEDWCPPGMQGLITSVDGGRHISRDDEEAE